MVGRIVVISSEDSSESKNEEKSVIYMVTVIGFPGGDTEKAPRSRCWGYYLDKETAIRSIKENWTDIFEMAYYQYAVIESLPSGVCSYAEEEAWFGVTYPQGVRGDACAVEIEKPKFSESIGNWCLG